MTSGVRKKQNKKDCKYEEPDGRIKFRCCKEDLRNLGNIRKLSKLHGMIA